MELSSTDYRKIAQFYQIPKHNNKSYKEISETLGISEVNARVKMNRTKDKLRKILNP